METLSNSIAFTLFLTHASGFATHFFVQLSRVWSWGPNLTLESWPSLGTRANVTWHSDRSKTCDNSLLADMVKICEDPMIIVGPSP